MYIVGIDPGLEGALVLLKDTQVTDHLKMPVIKLKHGSKTKVHYDITAIFYFLESIKDSCGDKVHVYMEEVSAAPGQGVTSMFTMGYGVGVLTGLITALRLPLTTVRPQTWKKDLLSGLPRDKMASCVIVSRLFPRAVPIIQTIRGSLDHNIADAVLIAEWGKRQHE